MGLYCEVNAIGQKEYENSLAFRVLRNTKKIMLAAGAKQHNV